MLREWANERHGEVPDRPSPNHPAASAKVLLVADHLLNAHLI